MKMRGKEMKKGSMKKDMSGMSDMKDKKKAKGKNKMDKLKKKMMSMYG